VRVLATARNSKKLRRGVHRANQFRILLRGFTGSTEELHQTLRLIQETGVPNYFGPQRFGHGGNNVDRALAMFDGSRIVRKRAERSILISAARSWIFNEVLSQRVNTDCWHTIRPGDVMQLQGSPVCFTPEWQHMDKNELDVLKQRLVEGDISLTGPLWGKGTALASLEAADFEQREKFPDLLCSGLEQAGLKQERRALQLRPTDLHLESAPDKGLMVEFTLPRGGYATSVLRELVSLGF
jgi:tRNA pseudouridine13 synthase